MSEERVTRAQESGQITYATEVISTIVTVATLEVEGISGITGGGAISGIITRGKTPRGVRVDVKGDQVSVDLSVSVDYGIPIQKVGRNCQENVRKSIETMTGLHVERVDLHVVSVSFEKENQELDKGQRLALSLDGETAEEKAERIPEKNAQIPETPAGEEEAEGETAAFGETQPEEAPEPAAEETEEAPQEEETGAAAQEPEEDDQEGAQARREQEPDRAETAAFAFSAEPEAQEAEEPGESDTGTEEEAAP